MPTILITGANGGIGGAIGRAFLEGDPEARVWLGVRRGRENAEALAANFPGRARLVDLDVSDAASWEKAVAAMMAEDGRVDVLVNNAGHHDDALLAMMPRESWDSVIASNLTGVFLGCQAVIKPMMGQRFGRIINIASLSALVAPSGQANYAAAKAGVLGLSRSFSKEAARAGVTVNSLCPGFIETAALREMDETARKSAAARVPMRRLGRPDEVAAAAVFLASPAASYITGSEIKIDGGLI